jgi:pimeloyl-ACP methyl ester carboxylesterase
MLRSAPVDGFSLAHEHHGSGPAVVLLHGWPGDHGDWREVVPRLGNGYSVVVPDLRGFGESDKPTREPEAFGAAGQAASILGLISELGCRRPVLAGYDVGSRVAQHIARSHPEAIGGLVLAPPLPGVGERVLSPSAQSEFWYQPFHRLALSTALIDGRPEAVRSYLEHFWCHWSGPSFRPADAELARLSELYGAPGAFAASINWYRAGSGTVATALAETAPAPQDRIAVPTTVLWPEHDPLFPTEWSDRVHEFFSAASVEMLPGVGHFSPLEAPERFAAAITAASRQTSGASSVSRA